LATSGTESAPENSNPDITRRASVANAFVALPGIKLEGPEMAHPVVRPRGLNGAILTRSGFSVAQNNSASGILEPEIREFRETE
jgi:hypothetical protein